MGDALVMFQGYEKRVGRDTPEVRKEMITEDQAYSIC